jgi:hypothetical protein
MPGPDHGSADRALTTGQSGCGRMPDGELDVTGLIAYVQQTGVDGPYCVEVSYPEYPDLSVDETATRRTGR